MTIHDLMQSKKRVAGGLLVGEEYKYTASCLSSPSTKRPKRKIENYIDSCVNPSQEIAALMMANGMKPERLPDTYEVEYQDVVCGRGKSQYERPGNRRFLDIINKYVESYKSTKYKKHKATVLCNIVHEVRIGDGRTAARFVKQKEDGTWWEIGDSLARDKAGQAMRVAVRMRTKQKAAFVAANDFPPEPNARKSIINNPERERLRQELAVAKRYDSPDDSSSASAPLPPSPSAGGISQEEINLLGGKICTTDGSTRSSSSVLDTSAYGGAATATTVKDLLSKLGMPAELGGMATAHTIKPPEFGGMEQPLGRLWLVVRDTWQPGASTDVGVDDVLWVGRTVKYVFPSSTSIEQPSKD